MHIYEFKVEDSMEELSDLVFSTTNSYLEKKTKELQDELLQAVSEDVETFIYERFDNVRRRYFGEVSGFLLGKEIYLTNKKTLQQWLQATGYTEESFRKKIFEDNKGVIIEAIKTDAEYEFAKNLFNSNYFKSWTFSDLSTWYPQSEVVRNILWGLVNQKGFTEVFTEMLDVETKKKMAHLNDIKKKIAELGILVD